MSTIACVKSIHPKTYIAGAQFYNGEGYVSFLNSQVLLYPSNFDVKRIFYQVPDGAIYATTTDDFGATWKGGAGYELVPKGRAKMETPMASVFFKSNEVSTDLCIMLIGFPL